MKTIFSTISIYFLFVHLGMAQTFIPGEIYFGDNEYIEYKAGNLPIVISASHGGDLEPNDIPDRNCTSCVYGKDLFTQELIREIDDAIFDLFGCHPHIIINRLHRKKLDANRAIGEAADGNAIAEQSWNEFQGFIENAKDTIEANYTKGLYIDLHGHGHDIQRLELGYRITKSELQLSDATLDQDVYVNDASIKHLVNNNSTNLKLSELLRGTESFGQFYEQENYPAVPSFDDPYPESSEAYFRGGYNTERHGSKVNGTIDAIQIECNMDGVRNTDSNRKDFAEATALVIKNYLETHYFQTGATSNCGFVTALKKEITPSSITINSFPNPVNNYLNVTLTGEILNPFSFSISNELGQIIYKKNQIETPSFQIDFHDFPKGLYFLKVETNHFIGIKKIIK